MKNLGNSSCGRSQRVPKIFRALCGHLCNSTAFLFYKNTNKFDKFVMYIFNMFYPDKNHETKLIKGKYCKTLNFGLFWLVLILAVRLELRNIFVALNFGVFAC